MGEQESWKREVANDSSSGESMSGDHQEGTRGEEGTIAIAREGVKTVGRRGRTRVAKSGARWEPSLRESWATETKSMPGPPLIRKVEDFAHLAFCILTSGWRI